MALRDIMVSVDGGPRVAQTLDVAIELARRHEAHLTGVYGASPYVPAPYAFAQVDTGTVLAQQQLVEERAAEAERLFRERAGRAGIEARCDWRVVAAHPIDALSRLGRHADLVVMTQAGTSQDEGPVTWPGEVLFGVGRPVLVVPWAGRFPVVGERVMIAWNGTREAARAVHDALPVLEKARAITVLTIEPGLEAATAEGDLPDTDLLRHLARHDLPVEAARTVAGDDVKPWEVLLNEIADRGIDLLVMGAYGHSRLREFVFGGMTLSVLRQMTVPVLMSH